MRAQRLPFAGTSIFSLDGRVVEFPEGVKTDEYTHTLHRFPGKFIPQVVQEILALHSDLGRTPALVADPFCGSGTTLLECAVEGIPSVGIDFDPLSAFLSAVKTTPLGPTALERLRCHWRTERWKTGAASHLPAVANLDHWFTRQASNELGYLKSHALALDDPDLRSFSLAVFSSIIRRVSNADDQTQKTYVSHTLRKNPPSPCELFPVFMDRAIAGIQQYSRACVHPPTVARADARDWLPSNAISHIITSPPYIDSIDYVYNQMLEYFWMYEQVGLATIEEVKQLRKKPMGFSKVAVTDGFAKLRSLSADAAQLLDPYIKSIAEKSQTEAMNVIGYFLDFNHHLEASAAAVKGGTSYTLVIGDSFIRGVTVPTNLILRELFRRNGFHLEGTCSYVIKRHYMKFPRRSNSGKITKDHIIVFRRQ